jgi:hypothetical protein
VWQKLCATQVHLRRDDGIQLSISKTWGACNKAFTAFRAQVPSLVDIIVQSVTKLRQSHLVFNADTSRKSDFSGVAEPKFVMYFNLHDMSLFSVK